MPTLPSADDAASCNGEADHKAFDDGPPGPGSDDSGGGGEEEAAVQNKESLTKEMESRTTSLTRTTFRRLRRSPARQRL